MASLVLSAAQSSAEPGYLDLFEAQGYVSQTTAAFKVIQAFVAQHKFRRLRLIDGDLKVTNDELTPITKLVGEVSAEWSADRRNRRSYTLERTRQVFEVILSFQAWVDLDPFERALESSGYLSVPSDPENGIDRRFVLVLSKSVKHPKQHESPDGTEATYRFESLPYLPS